MPDFYAHSKPGRPLEEWEPLEVHLEKVASLAASFAREFDAEEWGRLAGLWHDLGKYSRAFQDYLRSSSAADGHVGELKGTVDHSTAGAQQVVRSEGVLGHLLAYCIAGHHSGLPDGRSDGTCLEARLRKLVEPWSMAPGGLQERAFPSLPAFLAETLGHRQTRTERKEAAFSFAFFTRMVYSCLVDADFLATEEFLDPQRSDSRPAFPSDVLELMEESLDRFCCETQWPASPVNELRSRIRSDCLAAGEWAPGLFSLSVPTGGGKTLSSLAFALRHAVHNGLRRVIYVAPFTTILEQNTRSFRRALDGAPGLDPETIVLEHHSAVDLGAETARSRLAAENWDVPLVVTTSVQFYESLFANRSARCRKLHRLARAVIILDEAQALPVDFLAPCLSALRELTRHYGATVVLCTATQPAIEKRDGFEIGLEAPREIVSDRAALFTALRRVRVTDLGRLSDLDLAHQLARLSQVLCIVNTRAHARRLYELLSAQGDVFHLSARMCPAHRSQKLEEIRSRLLRGLNCRVVSTQLVEAGVDIDFPVVYRSVAGLDSIAQAAGRCNRNGLLPELGSTFVFRSEHDASERFFAETAGCALQLLPLYDEPLSPKAIEHYFRLYYWEQGSRWDSERILDGFHLDQDPALPFAFGFARVAQSFRLIEDSAMPVIVPWCESGAALVRELRARWQAPDRQLHRRLQRYTVSIPRRTWEKHAGAALELLGDRYAVIFSPELHYSEELGVILDEPSEDALIT